MLRSEKNKDKQTERETMANSKCNLFNSSAKIFQSIKFQFFFPWKLSMMSTYQQRVFELHNH